MDEDFLLTVETLSLNREIIKGAPVRGVVALKTRAADGYLVVNEAQQVVLDAFHLPQTVPHMLGTAIFKRTCLELREFYELILKAYRVGVLTSGTSVAVPARTARKWMPVPWRVTTIFALLSLVALFALLALRHPLRPVLVLDYVFGWLAWIVALSAGFALATSTLKSAGGELLRPRWHWTLPIPYFSVDLRDTCMRTLNVRVAVALARIAPLAAFSAIGLALNQAWVAGPLIGLLIVANPWLGPVAELRLLLGGNPRLDTDQNFLFSTNRLPRRKLRTFFHGESFLSAVWGIIFGMLWAAIAVRLMYGILQLPVVERMSGLATLKLLGISLGVGLGVVGFGIAAWCAVVFAMRRGGRLYARLRRQLGRWSNAGAPILDQSQLLRAMGQSAVFRSIAMPQQVDIAKVFEVSRFKAWRTLIPFEPDPTQVGLILRGSATIHRRGANGRTHPVHRLKEGDIFGAHRLVNREHPKLEIRARTPLVALMLPVPLFDDQIVRRIGVDRSRCLVDTCSFLRSLRLCQQWQLSSVMRMADITQTKIYQPGDTIVTMGEDPRSFFVVWEGEVKVKRDARVVGRIVAGEFFGEAELLQNSAMTADFIAVETTRCLCVPRAEFVRFVTHNYHVALSLERVASERLGHPIFPLQSSFEVR